ncbi:uncharacterized protein BO96DRAFT_438631 [Aspergillus niger CBS 101883]|uniref:uncharacterized protein n=1 Tax=Aspergillus lacticoffeatus (strain CBS 101883) TaxID=1450533 RepID=UPI000D7F6F79|nr:uncharacterized protein BO96DRAFT_438631 [Aspergillus niger CBS 101883]PYH51775.1 hypothetical protein BO96DRAFT_438631 [Aspergillus niger CBS 101883]
MLTCLNTRTIAQFGKPVSTDDTYLEDTSTGPLEPPTRLYGVNALLPCLTTEVGLGCHTGTLYILTPLEDVTPYIMDYTFQLHTARSATPMGEDNGCDIVSSPRSRRCHHTTLSFLWLSDLIPGQAIFSKRLSGELLRPEIGQPIVTTRSVLLFTQSPAKNGILLINCYMSANPPRPNAFITGFGSANTTRGPHDKHPSVSGIGLIPAAPSTPS